MGDSAEERRLLELDEAIEAVDAAIEFKNEVICSRTRELKSPTETGLLTRLMSLTHVETRSLLCKYFHKVIDLREGSKKIEQQFAELETHIGPETHAAGRGAQETNAETVERRRIVLGRHRPQQQTPPASAAAAAAAASASAAAAGRRLRSA